MAAKLIYLTDTEFELLVKNLNFGSTTSDSINIEHKLVFMRDKFKDNERITRKEAISKCHGIAYPEAFVQALEALRLMSFKEEELTDREKFRQALNDNGHPEATVYGHWALKAYDEAHPK